MEKSNAPKKRREREEEGEGRGEGEGERGEGRGMEGEGVRKRNMQICCAQCARVHENGQRTWRFLSEMEEEEEEEDSLVKIPQMQYIDKVVDVPVVHPIVQFLDKIVDVLVFKLCKFRSANRGTVDQYPHSCSLWRRSLFFLEIPIIQTVYGTQTSESLVNSLDRQAAQAAEVVQVETPILAESQALKLWWIASNPLPW